MTWASSVPYALDALMAAARGEPDLSGVTVWDGPDIDGSSAAELIAVGYAGGEDDEAVDATLEVADLGRTQSRETYTIRCAIAVRRGGTGQMAEARARAYELLAILGRTLAADPRLGGAVMSAAIGSHQLRPRQSRRGVEVVLPFDVEIDAFTRRQ